MTCILLAEDELELRRSFADLLELEGFDVLEAEDGAEALTHIARSEDIDLLITDINMLRFSGIEVAEHARLKFPSIPLLFMTSDIDLIKSHFIASPFICLSKPSSCATLLKAVRDLLPITRAEAA